MFYVGLALCAISLITLARLGWKLMFVNYATQPASRQLNRIGWTIAFLVFITAVGIGLLVM